MMGTVFLREFSQLLMKHGASLEDLIGMVYTKEELDPLTEKYKKYFDLITVSRDPGKYSAGFSYKVRYKIDLTGNRIPSVLFFSFDVIRCCVNRCANDLRNLSF